MTKRQDIIEWIDGALSGSVLDTALTAAGFARRKGSLFYQRHSAEFEQQFGIVFDVGPSYEPTALAHLLPQVVYESGLLGDMVHEMSGGDPDLVGVGVTRLVLRHQLQNLAPKGQDRSEGSRWFIREKVDVPNIIDRIGAFVSDWALPFLQQYRDVISLIRGYETGDERLRLDRRFCLYLAAGYVHSGQIDKAQGVLDEVFGRPAQRSQYERAFAYIKGLRA